MVFITRAVEHTGGKLKNKVPDSFVKEMLVSRCKVWVWDFRCFRSVSSFILWPVVVCCGESNELRLWKPTFWVCKLNWKVDLRGLRGMKLLPVCRIEKQRQEILVLELVSFVARASLIVVKFLHTATWQSNAQKRQLYRCYMILLRYSFLLVSPVFSPSLQRISGKGNVWDNAAYTFGSYFKILKQQHDKSTKPLYDCTFDGRAVFAGPHLYKQWNYTPECIVSTPIH